ncbi:hypothetical protein [Rhizobium sp. AAP43]|uniref:hypothetical protein n=1 Tax=Rhizobium sp. AAP43 TaxID=1523420 RepID=UPI0006B9B4DF|nr:hypothetical protein [Rhizobium sp. AAP43]KPF47056.1 hypothetical protein IP76_01770 [Rhizobium sp. AAP43]
MTNTIDKGYGFGMRFPILDELGQKEALTGAAIEWKLAASASGMPLIERETGDMTISTAAGTVEFTLTSIETGALQPGRYYHQLAVAPAGKERKVYFSGFLKVEARL